MADPDDLVLLPQDTVHDPDLVYMPAGQEHVSVQKHIPYKRTIDNIDLTFDIYYPQNFDRQSSLPAVVFVHGDGTPQQLATITERKQFQGWGRLIASTGLIAIIAQHRSSETLSNVVGVANDIDDLLSYIREQSSQLHIDADQLGIWTCSSGGPFALRAALLETPPYIRAIVCYYSFTELRTYYEVIFSSHQYKFGPPPPFSEDDFIEFSARDLLLRRTGPVAPLLIARAGMDDVELNEALDAFIAEAINQNVTLTLFNHPTGQHAFDVLDDNERSHEIIQGTLAFLHTHLLQ